MVRKPATAVNYEDIDELAEDAPVIAAQVRAHVDDFTRRSNTVLHGEACTFRFQCAVGLSGSVPLGITVPC